MDAIKTMYVVKVTDPNHEAFGQYYGGFNKGSERPYYVKKIAKAKWHSNPRDIFVRDHESVVTINFTIGEEMIQERECQSLSHTNTILTSNGISLNAYSAHPRLN